jgi:hypothetical protein
VKIFLGILSSSILSNKRFIIIPVYGLPLLSS